MMGTTSRYNRGDNQENDDSDALQRLDILRLVVYDFVALSGVSGAFRPSQKSSICISFTRTRDRRFSQN
jgi:hypothetical protein